MQIQLNFCSNVFKKEMTLVVQILLSQKMDKN